MLPFEYIIPLPNDEVDISIELIQTESDESRKVARVVLFVFGALEAVAWGTRIRCRKGQGELGDVTNAGYELAPLLHGRV